MYNFIMENKVYCCIDLKSFFASVEAVDRGLNPFTTNLVVADSTRGKGSICLAITPAMKALGISYTDKATVRKRNKLIGGHNGE